MRHLILFDIDGTLVSGGPAKLAFQEAMMEVYGATGPVGGYVFSGKTDPQIARGLLDATGMDPREIEAGFEALWEAYLGGLAARLGDAPMDLLAGVGELMVTLQTDPDVALGLVTGNILPGARLKLESVGFGVGDDGHFIVGGYGSDHEMRDHLPGIAMERARRHWEVDFSRDRIWVVGDTPLDVQCGLHHGVRTLAVATGNYSVDELEATGAHVVVPDFRDLAQTTEILLNG
ncbi:MAG: HAD hydrolase-like protein [Gemmatimonadota bacterium]